MSLLGGSSRVHAVFLCNCMQSKSEANLVAMDFSGKSGGRVIQNPMEAQSAEREEGLAWRVSRGIDLL